MTTTKTSATSLQAKILAINTSNENSEKILNYEFDQLIKYLGQNILKADGSFKAKINHIKHEEIKGKINAFGFDWWQSTNYWFSATSSKLTLNINTSVSGGGCDINMVSKYCIYEKDSIDLFAIDSNGNLQLLETQYFKNIQYKEDEILEAQRKIKLAAEDYKKTLSLMPYQFMTATNCERLTR